MIRRLHLQNVRGFDDVTVDLLDPGTGEPTAWTAILGAAGTGKTTLLEAIVLGASSDDRARDTVASAGRRGWLTRGAERGTVTVELGGATERPVLRRTVHLHRTDDGEEVAGIEETKDPDAPLTDRPPVCWAGSACGDDVPTDDILGSVRSDGRVSGLLERILGLPKGSIGRGSDGRVEVGGPWGDPLPLDALGEAYRSTIEWLVQLLAFLESRRPGSVLDDGPIEGVVLVDEIERHLPPDWQRRLPARLRRELPDLQFVVTTQSPLVVAGCGDLDDAEVGLVHLRRLDGEVRAHDGLEPPRDLRVDQILTSPLFGLETTSSDVTKVRVHRYSELLSRVDRKLTPDEEKERETLRRELGQTLGSRETPLEQAVSRRMDAALDDVIVDRLRGKLRGVRRKVAPRDRPEPAGGRRSKRGSRRGLDFGDSLEGRAAPDLDFDTGGAVADAPDREAVELEMKRQLKALLE